MAKKGKRYVDHYLTKERAKGRRFSQEQEKQLERQYEGIYLHSDGKRFIAVANVPYIDAKARKRYKRPEKTFKTVTDARNWLEEKRVESRKGVEAAEAVDPTLAQIMEIAQPKKEILPTWNRVQRWWRTINEYFGSTRKVRTIKDRDIIAYQAWLLTRPNGKLWRSEDEDATCPTIQPITVNAYCGELLWLIREAHRLGLIKVMPQYTPIATFSHRPLNITLQDFLKVVDAFPQHRALLLLALNTGARKGDIFRLTLDRIAKREVLQDGKRLMKTVVTVRSTKTNKENIQVPMLRKVEAAYEAHIQQQNAWLQRFYNDITDPKAPNHRRRVAWYQRCRAALHHKVQKQNQSKCPIKETLPDLKPLAELRGPEDLNPMGLVFVSKQTLRPYKSIGWALDSAIKRAGVAEFSMHSVRHLATTVLLDITGGDVDQVQRIIGWSSTAMLQIYGHIAHRHLKTFEKFDELLGDAEEWAHEDQAESSRLKAKKWKWKKKASAKRMNRAA